MRDRDIRRSFHKTTQMTQSRSNVKSSTRELSPSSFASKFSFDRVDRRPQSDWEQKNPMMPIIKP
jgi:hypothetical protein